MQETFKLGKVEIPESEIKTGEGMEQNGKHLSHAMLLWAHMQTPETHMARSLSIHQWIMYLYAEPQGNMKTTV